jgi:uncharacterized membrane protein YkvA (DUF1232 family)
MSGRLRRWGRGAHTDLSTLAWALRDGRTPVHARVVTGLTVGLAASPLAPVPGVVPVLGAVDDLLLVPLGVWLSKRLVPGGVLADANSPTAESRPGAGRWATLVAALVLVAWAAVALAVAWWLRSSGALASLRAVAPV